MGQFSQDRSGCVKMKVSYVSLILCCWILNLSCRLPSGTPRRGRSLQRTWKGKKTPLTRLGDVASFEQLWWSSHRCPSLLKGCKSSVLLAKVIKSAYQFEGTIDKTCFSNDLRFSAIPKWSHRIRIPTRRIEEWMLQRMRSDTTDCHCFHIDDSIAVLWLGWIVSKDRLNTKNSVTCRIPRWNIWNQLNNSQSRYRFTDLHHFAALYFIPIDPESITNILYLPFMYSYDVLIRMFD